MSFNLENLKQKINDLFVVENIDLFIEKIIKYKEFLVAKNKVMNLTRLDEEDKIYEQYFFNSLVPFVNIDLNNKNVLDIGSGSGIPGIVLKILFPSIKLTIIEANNKKINFLKELCKQLDLNDVILINERAEKVSKDLYEQFDIVTSRAVASIGILIEISSCFLKLDGLLIEPKSIHYNKEWNLVSNKINDYGIELLDIKKIDDINVVFYFKKIHKTKALYPRNWQQIVKDYKPNDK